MFAIVRTGGKQYRVAAGDKIVVEKLDGEAGSSVTLGDVLLAGEQDVAQGDGVARRSGELLDDDLVSGGDAILLAARAHDSEHGLIQ